MNAAEFLALIEKHPLPWEYEDAYAGRGQYICRETDEEVPLNTGLVFFRNSLHDAAPAMAAAILKYLGPDSSGRQRARSGPEAVALRAALPESLRAT